MADHGHDAGGSKKAGGKDGSGGFGGNPELGPPAIFFIILVAAVEFIGIKFFGVNILQILIKMAFGGSNLTPH